MDSHELQMKLQTINDNSSMINDEAIAASSPVVDNDVVLSTELESIDVQSIAASCDANSLEQINNLPTIPQLDLANIETGLTAEEVKYRNDKGLVNSNMDMPTKSYRQIILGNTLTLFNLMNTLFAIATVIWGSFKNAAFFFIVIINTLLCIIQEVKAKRAIDHLSLISAPKVTVLRDRVEVSISVPEIVMDDIMVLRSGNQICSDCTVLFGDCEVDESMITGETDPVPKHAGEELLSGSFIISGSVKARVIRIGVDNYAAKICNGARYIKPSNSEIRNSVSSIIKLVTAITIPLCLVLFPQQIFLVDQPLSSAVVVSVSAVISMMPQGLVLLTSMVFTLGVVKLSMHKTLAQDLYCIETLARVDVLCLDKTGTITTGEMNVNEICVLADGYTENDIINLLRQTAGGIGDNNPTARAIQSYVKGINDWDVKSIIPFSSARKWSGVNFVEHGSYAMGAVDFIMDDVEATSKTAIDKYMNEGKRVIGLIKCNDVISSESLSDSRELLALVIISDQIREEAPDTLAFFAEQNVNLKIISGDNPVTVSQIAKRAGLKGSDDYIDASTLKDDSDIADALGKYTVFGRVTPEQKLVIVKELKKAGHTVGMTGDGVNDVLALKEADCSVVMASGSDAARSVAQLVLLDNNFASMPKVVAEGRQSINNLQRSSTLFLVKTIYATVLALIIIITNKGYPFETLQLSLISTISVGIPSILLAVEPNRELVKGKFIHNAIRNSLPFSLTILITLLTAIWYSDYVGLSLVQTKTLSSAILAINMFMILFRVCLPLNLKRTVMFSLLLVAYILCFVVLRDFFSFCRFNNLMWYYFLPCLILTYPIILTMIKLIDKWLDKKQLEKLDKLLALSNKIKLKY